jgi:hypothetical protein
MWRLLLRRCHPDAGGTDDLFIWARELREHVTGDRVEDWRSRTRQERRQPPPHPTSSARDRIDYAVAFDRAASFGEFTERIAALADSGEVPERFAALLRLVRDCYEAHDGPLHRMQHEGAPYRTLAAIAHAAGMSKDQRVGWYRLCESMPLSQRHAGHIMGRIKREAA